MEEIKKRQLDVERFKDDLASVTGQVYFILKEFQHARSSDGVLLVHWLQLFKGIDSFNGLMSMAENGQFNFETVRRSRQKLQAAGYWLPEDETVRKRRKLETVWRAVLGAGEAS